ncbi:hypothetical protein H7F15_15315 [Pontibacter sp. Tf4]|uniref:hypothetical protein n=1 Tax=Pontibacter sp. Tf4 TaxID=2761620 RepID=UPI001627BEFC|nr:hypothetical protein [Pontibacter sp. Tf4]MBB6612415.1 hypothetical protein [Pontibacter sp. Tf4]
MNSVILRGNYRLYAFAGYQSMRDALPYLPQVVLAKALTDVAEADVRSCLQRVPESGFKNYLQPLAGQQHYCSAKRSFISALQLLYKSNGYSARYVVIARG